MTMNFHFLLELEELRTTIFIKAHKDIFYNANQDGQKGNKLQ